MMTYLRLLVMICITNYSKTCKTDKDINSLVVFLVRDSVITSCILYPV
jgi:hypothetical protein